MWNDLKIFRFSCANSVATHIFMNELIFVSGLWMNCVPSVFVYWVLCGVVVFFLVISLLGIKIFHPVIKMCEKTLFFARRVAKRWQQQQRLPNPIPFQSNVSINTCYTKRSNVLHIFLTISSAQRKSLSEIVVSSTSLHSTPSPFAKHYTHN